MSESPLRLLLDFDARSQRDQNQPPAFLHRRDRKFALTSQPEGAAATARAWLAQLERLSGPGGGPRASTGILGQWRRIHTGFAVTGVITGIATMSGLLFYDGGQRINITLFLSFVALQLILALFTSLQSLPASSVILCWAGAGQPELPQALTGPDTRIFLAGGHVSLAQDRETLSTIGDLLTTTTTPAVILVVRSWEPPTGELSDFLEAARTQWPDYSNVVLVPLSQRSDQEPGEAHLAQWLRFADRMTPGFVSVSVPRMEWHDPHLASGELS